MNLTNYVCMHCTENVMVSTLWYVVLFFLCVHPCVVLGMHAFIITMGVHLCCVSVCVCAHKYVYVYVNTSCNSMHAHSLPSFIH